MTSGDVYCRCGRIHVSLQPESRHRRAARAQRDTAIRVGPEGCDSGSTGDTDDDTWADRQNRHLDCAMESNERLHSKPFVSGTRSATKLADDGLSEQNDEGRQTKIYQTKGRNTSRIKKNDREELGDTEKAKLCRRADNQLKVLGQQES